MGFFDDLRLPTPDPEEEEDVRTPAWLAPPEDWLGGVVPIEVMLGQSEDAAVFISRLTAYPVGFSYTLEICTRQLPDFAIDPFGGHHRYSGLSDDDRLPPELIRYGLQYPDGRKASGLGHFLEGGGGSIYAFGDVEPPDPDEDLILTMGGGHGGGRRSSHEWWVWPLPPETGHVSFVCEWPQCSISESTATVESAQIRAAAARAQQLWREEDRGL